MLIKSTAPIDLQVFRRWLEAFDEAEMIRHRWSKNDLEDCLQRYDYVYLSDNGGLVAIIFFYLASEDVLEVVFLATRPGARRSGAMFDLFSQWIAAHPNRQIWLECREDNWSARRLYGRLGLRESGQRRNYYSDGTAAILFNF